MFSWLSIIQDVQSLKLDDYSMTNSDADDDPFNANTFEVKLSPSLSSLSLINFLPSSFFGMHHLFT